VAAPMWDRIARREQICRSAQNPPDFAAVEMDTRLSNSNDDCTTAYEDDATPTRPGGVTVCYDVRGCRRGAGGKEAVDE
jgi:hypothetical protein